MGSVEWARARAERAWRRSDAEPDAPAGVKVSHAVLLDCGLYGSAWGGM
jgi:hypothetical protein